MKYRFVDEDDDASSAILQLSLFDAAIGKLMWSELHSVSDIALCIMYYWSTDNWVDIELEPVLATAQYKLKILVEKMAMT